MSIECLARIRMFVSQPPLPGSGDMKKEGAEGVWEPRVKGDQSKTASSGQPRAAVLMNLQKLWLPV